MNGKILLSRRYVVLLILGLLSLSVVTSASSAIPLIEVGNVSPRGEGYVPANSVIRVETVASRSFRIYIEGYGVKPDGTKVRISDSSHVSAADGSQTFKDINVFGSGEGWILSLSTNADNNPKRGELYMTYAIDGPAPNYPRVTFLASDYVDMSGGLTFPNGRIISSEEGSGFKTHYYLNASDPAQSFTLTAPKNRKWCVDGIRFALETGSDTRNREMSLIVDEPDKTIPNAYRTKWQSAVSPVQTQNQWRTYDGQKGYPLPFDSGFNTNTIARFFIPDGLCVYTGGRVRVAVVGGGLPAGDIFREIVLDVEEWVANKPN